MPSYMKTKALLRCGFISAALLVSNYAFAVGEGPAIIDRWVEDSKSHSFIELSYQSLDYDEATDVTSVNGFRADIIFNFAFLASRGETGPKISYLVEVPMLRYFALSENADRYSADSIEAEQLTVTDSLEGVPLGSLVADFIGRYNGKAVATHNDVVLSAPDWAKLPDIFDEPTKPVSKYYPFAAALADINLASLTIANSEFSQTFEGATSIKTAHGASEYGKTRNGNASSFSLVGLNSAADLQADGEQSDTEVKTMVMDIARIEGGIFNAGTLVRQFDPSLPTSQRETPFIPLLDSLTVTGTELRFDDDVNLSVADMTYSDWGVRPPSIPLLKLADQLYLEAKEGDTEPNQASVARFMASLYSMHRIGAFEMRGFGMDVADVENDTELSAQLDSFRLADIWSGGLGELSFEGLLSEGKGTTVRWDLFQLKDIGFPSLDALLDVERAFVEMDVSAIVAGLPTVGLIEASGIDVNIKDDPGFKLGLGRLEMGEFIGRLPTRASSIIEAFEYNVAVLPPVDRKPLERLGYERVNLSILLSFIWDEASEILSLESRNALDDGGTLNAAVEIGSVPRSVFEDPETAQNALAFLTFNAASMVFDDNSIVDRAIEATASDQGKSADQLKQELLGALPFVMGALNKPDFVDEVAKAVSKFLSEGGSLTATAQPDQPVSVMQVIAGGAAAPGTLVDLLNVEVIAE